MRWILTWLWPEDDLGRRGEQAAERYLKRLGYKILFRRQRSRLGEIDLIVRDGNTIVFVEVKTRESHEKGHPTEAVGPAKRDKLTRLALAFLKRHGLLEHPTRFDVVSVTWPQDNAEPEVEHFRNAFEPDGHNSMFS